jgi:hypothetical protein
VTSPSWSRPEPRASGPPGRRQPADSEQLALAHPRGECQDVERFQPIAGRRRQEQPGLLLVEGPHLVVGERRGVDQVGDVAGHDSAPSRPPERPVQDGVQMVDGACREARLEFVGVEPLQVPRLELGEGSRPNAGMAWSRV